VLDEADQLLEKQGQQTQVLKLKKLLPQKCQYLLFSATYTDEVAEFAETFVPPPRASIRLKPQELSLEKISQFYVDCGSEANKFHVLDDIYGYLGTGKSVIFAKSKKDADALQKKLAAEEHVVGLFSSELSPAQRDAAMDDFISESGKIRVLVCTDLLARGVDVKNLTLVVNYDLPHVKDTSDVDAVTYLHRIGRTGRFGASGIAINLVHDKRSMREVEQLSQFYKKPILELKVADMEKLGTMLEKLGR